jgi:probable F420-dependent oxidoreductase
MRFGFHAINLGPLATLESVRQIVAACERHKIDSLWTGDHIINAAQISSTYPYSPTGKFPLAPEESILEPLAFMGFVAGQTSTIRIGVSVLIVPYRNPVVTARAISTLDFLSAGRIIVGVGSGWMKEEFDALGVPFAERGAQTDEFIRIFKAIWTNPRPQFAGKYYQFSGITAYPQPTQRPHPPIWVGGNSKRAMRRALELGDGWQPGWSRPDQLAQELQDFRRVAERVGRDPKSVELSLLRPMQILDRGTDSRRPLIGTPEQVAEDIHAYQQLGVTHLVFSFRTRALSEALETIERFATQVRPLVS